MTDERSKQPPGDNAPGKAAPRANPFAAARPPGRISLGNLPKIPKPTRPASAPLPPFGTTQVTTSAEPEGLEEDSGDLPTSNLSTDALPDLELMRIGSSSSWDDDTHDASEAPPLAAPSLADESRDAMPVFADTSPLAIGSFIEETPSDIEGDDGFEDEHTLMVDAEFDAPTGLVSHTDVEDVEDLDDDDLVELPEDIDPTTNIPQEDVQEALRLSGAFETVSREDFGAANELDPEPTQMSWTPGPAPSPDAGPRGPRTQLGVGAVHASHHAPASAIPTTDLTEEVAAPIDLAEGPGFEVQATEILDSVFESEAVAPKLKLNQGPAAGQEYFARELRVTVGRAENNTIQLPDPALSRTHFEIVKNPDESFTLRDIDSANGTYLNGQRIREASLFDGDSIEVGKSVAIFVCAAATPRSYRHLVPVATETVAGALPPIDEHTRLATLEFDKSTRLFTRITLAAGAIASVFIVALVVLIVTRNPKAEAEASTPVVAELDDTRVKAQELYLQGVEAVRARDWASARAKFDAAHAVDSSLEVAPQLQRIEHESKAQRLIEEARGLAEKDDIDGALAVIAKIPETSSYHEEASSLVRQNKGVKLSELYTKAQAEFTADELDASLSTLDTILAREPDHASAKDLRPRVLERQVELERQAALAVAAAAAAKKAEENTDPDPFASKATASKKNTRKRSKKSSGKSVSDQAAAHADRGLKLLRDKKYKQARRALIDGEKASKSHPKVRDLSRALERMATSLYIKAANKKKTDPEAAAELCRTIMRMVPSSSPAWQKAKKLLTTVK